MLTPNSSGAKEAAKDGNGPHLPRALALSALSGVAALLIAGSAELGAVRVLGTDPLELDWLSDVILAIAFASAVFLRMRLKASRSEMSRLERTHLVLETQLAVAAEIQRRILPSPPDPSRGCRWAARLQPAGRVGGDFYDFIGTGPDSVLVVVADISGKGIPAAMLLASTRAVLHSIARQTQEPADVLTKLSAATYAEYEGFPYVTCLALHLDTARRRLVYANAGHPTGVILGNGHRRLLDVGGPPLGLFPATSYVSASLMLAPGDVGLVVTDGVTETLDASGYAPVEALDAVLSELGPSAQAESICDAIMRMVDRGTADAAAEGQDDRTIVVFTLEAESP